MVYFASWDAYAAAAEQLFRAAPDRTRFVVKYRHAEGTLVLKATDDFQCIKYRTDQMQDVKRFEKLSRTLLGVALDCAVAEYVEPPLASQPAGAGTGGGGKKKKGGKRH